MAKICTKKKRNHRIAVIPLTFDKVKLFQSNLCAFALELSLQFICLCLGNAFLNDLRSAVNDFLSFLQAKTGQLHERP